MQYVRAIKLGLTLTQIPFNATHFLTQNTSFDTWQTPLFGKPVSNAAGTLWKDKTEMNKENCVLNGKFHFEALPRPELFTVDVSYHGVD